jgi:phosphatidate cytidylyltransferase
MNNFTMRALTGFIFVAVLLGCILFGFQTYAGLFFVITILSLWEFYKLVETDGIIPQKIAGTIVGGILFILTTLVFNHTLSPVWLIIIFPFSSVILIVELFKKAAKPFTNIAFTLLGLLYVAVPFSLLNLLVFPVFLNGVYTPQILVGSFYILWSSDTGAYLSGRAFGKHKLFERISPKKTWEGLVGGGLISIGIANLIACYYTQLSRLDWTIIAIIIVVFGALGDLVESMFKRSIDAKDSGNILPGHGGLLDRFDGLLVSVSFVAAYLLLVK